MLVAKITLVVVEIIFKDDVVPSSVAKITFIVNETIFKVAVINFSVVISFCSDRNIFLLADISF